LKISIPLKELELLPEQPFDVPVTISRSRELAESARLELKPGSELEGTFQFAPVTVNADQTEVVIRVTPLGGKLPTGEKTLTVRATVLQQEKFPVVSEASLLLVFLGKD